MESSIKLSSSRVINRVKSIRGLINLGHTLVISPVIFMVGFYIFNEYPINKYFGLLFMIIALLLAIIHANLFYRKNRRSRRSKRRSNRNKRNKRSKGSNRGNRSNRSSR